jgi:glycosyltransferase involved in cell wall biosynthesis
VLYLQPAPLFGGAERQAAEQAVFLPKLGVKLTVIGGPGKALADWMSGAHDARYIESAHFPSWPPQRGWRAVSLPFRYVACGLAARTEFARVLREERSDVVVASLPFTWVVGSLVALAQGVPIVWRAGGFRVGPLQRTLLWLFTRFVRPDLLLCNGEAVRGRFHPLIGGPVAVLPNGVDPDVFSPSAGDARRYRPPGAELVVGFAGRLARSKHLEDLIALAVRLATHSPPVCLLVAGSGEEREHCRAAATAAGAKNLEFLGFVSDMPSFYAACDVIVLPSDSEGCSNVLLEAMHSRKAVVATNIPPVVEFVKDHETGLIYPLGDVAALTRAVEELLADGNLRAHLAANAEKAVADLTAPAAAEGLAHLLRDVVSRSSAAKTRALSTSLRQTTTPARRPGQAGARSARPSTRWPDPRRTDVWAYRAAASSAGSKNQSPRPPDAASAQGGVTPPRYTRVTIRIPSGSPRMPRRAPTKWSGCPASQSRRSAAWRCAQSVLRNGNSRYRSVPEDSGDER